MPPCTGRRYIEDGLLMARRHDRNVWRIERKDPERLYRRARGQLFAGVLSLLFRDGRLHNDQLK